MRDWPPCPPIQRDGGRRSRPGVNPFISALTVARCPATFSGVWPQLRDTLSTSRSVGRGTGHSYTRRRSLKPARCFVHSRSQRGSLFSGRSKQDAKSAAPRLPRQPRRRASRTALCKAVCQTGGAVPLWKLPQEKAVRYPPPRGAYRLFFGFGAPAVRLRKSRRGIGGVFFMKILSRTQRPPAAAKQAAKRARKCPLQSPSMPRQRRGPRPKGRAAQQFASMPTAPRRTQARTRRAKRRRPYPAAKQAKKAARERSISNPTMPRQRRGPALPDGQRSNPHPHPPQSSGIPARTRRAKRRRPAAKQMASKGIHAIQNPSLPSQRDGPLRSRAAQQSAPAPAQPGPLFTAAPRAAFSKSGNPGAKQPQTPAQNRRCEKARSDKGPPAPA